MKWCYTCTTEIADNIKSCDDCKYKNNERKKAIEKERANEKKKANDSNEKELKKNQFEKDLI